jgi:outer membrane protein assembly factor BamD (BamD/ComL family)
MNRNILLILSILVLFFASCGQGRQKTVKQITLLEKQLYTGQVTGFNRAKADSLLLLYEKFVQRYPKDSLAPKYLFQAAGLAMTLSDGRKSLELYEDFLKKFPDNPKAPVCLFFKAYVYENLITNYDKAKESYLQFIEKYPDHEFVKDARVALMNIGKTPDQLVREFEIRQKEESKRMADSLAAMNGKKSSRKK